MAIRAQASRVGTRFLILIIALVGKSATLWAQTSPIPVNAMAAAAAPGTEPSEVRLLVGRSTVVDVEAAITRVSLTSADVADALVTSPSQLLINGKMPGTISMFVWERSGLIRRYEVIVQRDLSRLTEQIQKLFPGESIAVQSNGKDVVLSGSVSSKDVIDKAMDLAAGYVDKREEVVSLMRLQDSGASNQVLLKVRFAEVNRNVLTEIGSSFFTSPTGVKNTLARVTTQQFAAPGYDEIKYGKQGFGWGDPVTSASGKFTFSDFLNLFLFSEKYDLGAMVKLLQTRGQFQSLAEPNLVAESGKEATFLAGGEFPVPIAQPSSGGIAVTILFKEFGVRLSFTPTVIGDRVHLKVRPEVSTLDFANGIVLAGFRIPALSTRRTETELELQNGQTFAIAGLLNNTASRTLQKMPGIGDIPILGELFKSRSVAKDRTELVVIITPQILPRNSHGVTPSLPRTPEPFLSPLRDKGAFEPPPPAFGSSGMAGSPVAAGTPQVPRQTPAVMTVMPDPGAAPSAAGAARAVSALTPSAPRPIEIPSAVAPSPAAAPDPHEAARPAPAAGVSAAPAVPMTTTGASPRAGSDTQAVPNSPDAPQTDAEKRQADAEKLRAQADVRAVGDVTNRSGKQAKEDRRRAEQERRESEKERQQQERLGREQAKRDAEQAREQAKRDAEQARRDADASREAAKKAGETAKKQAEADRKQQKLIEDAAARLKAAQDAYEAELAKKSGSTIRDRQ